MTQQIQVARKINIPKSTRKVFRVAIKYGVIRPGYSAIDYLREAIDVMGWECIIIGGKKGAAKSNLLLQHCFAIYQDWDTVLEHVVFEPESFLNLIDSRGRHPFIGWDDISVYLPRSIYFTDRSLWAELSKNWAAYRTKLSCFECTAPRKDKIASFILGDMTADIICYDRYKDYWSHYNMQRWLWQRNLKDPNSMNSRPVLVEDIPFPLTPDGLRSKPIQNRVINVGGVEYHGKEFYEKQPLTGVPRAIFKTYWKRRLELAEKAAKKFRELFEKRKMNKQPKLSHEEAGRLGGKKRWAEYNAPG